MASHKRAELVTEITHLRKQQMESFADGAFSGWPPSKRLRIVSALTVFRASCMNWKPSTERWS